MHSEKKHRRVNWVCVLFVITVVMSLVAMPTYMLRVMCVLNDQTELIEQLTDLHKSTQEILSQQIDTNIDQQLKIEELEKALADTPMRLVSGETYDWDDLYYCARLVAIEAGGCDERTQLGVAQVVWDRLHCTTYDWGSTIREVIDRPGQFTGGVYKGDMSQFPFAIEAVIQVFYAGHREFETNTYYFYNPHTCAKKALEWFETLPLIADYGDTVFRGM